MTHHPPQTRTPKTQAMRVPHPPQMRVPHPRRVVVFAARVGYFVPIVLYSLPFKTNKSGCPTFTAQANPKPAKDSRAVKVGYFVSTALYGFLHRLGTTQLAPRSTQ